MKLTTALACILVMLVMVLACAAFFGPSLAPATFCALADQSCTRDWIGAFSGWAAASLALAAALLALPPLRMQVAEAQKQTAFLLGDGDATLDLYPSRDMVDGGLIELRLTNWNRRSLEVKEIGISITEPGSFEASIMTMSYAGQDLKAGYVVHADEHKIIKFRAPIFLDGWENRAKPPVALVIDLLIAFEERIVLPATRGVAVKVGFDRLDSSDPLFLQAARRVEIRQRQSGQP